MFSQINRKIFLTILLHFFLIVVFAQKTKIQIEQDKKEKQKKIKEIEQILSEIDKKKGVTLGQLNAITEKVKLQEELMTTVNNEIYLLNKNINEVEVIIISLNNDIKNMRKEYAKMAYDYQKYTIGINTISFLFSSKSFKQFYMRYKYLKQYSSMRKKQYESIKEVYQSLIGQKKQFESKQKEKNLVLEDRRRENERLLAMQNEQLLLIEDLKKKEDEFNIKIEAEKQSLLELDKVTTILIEKEVIKVKPKVEVASDEVLTKSFEKVKNRHLWPVGFGFISSKFGKNRHKIFKKIFVENTGIDIQTRKNEKVKCIFDGIVKTKAFVPGMNNVVIVQHGEYYSVYSKLKNIDVNVGQKIKANQILGTVFTNNQGTAEVHFEIWKNTKKLNPQQWIK